MQRGGAATKEAGPRKTRESTKRGALNGNQQTMRCNLCTTICQLHLFCARFYEAILISQKPGRTEPAPPALHFEVFLCSCVSLVRRSFSEGGCFPAWLSPWVLILLLRLAAPWFIPALDRSPADHRLPSSALSPFPRAASRKRLIGDDSPYPTRPFPERVGRGIPAEPDGSENTFFDAALPLLPLNI